MNFTSMYKLYKWDKDDKKIDTITELANNAEKLESMFIQLNGVSVKQFDAKGDGITDDTKAFNDAITAMPNGGILIVPRGTYMIEGWAAGSVSDYPLGGIKLKSDITVKFMPGAKLKAKPTTYDNYAIINITNANNVRVLGGELIGERSTHRDDPNGQWGYGVAMVGSTDVTIKETVARDFFGDGFVVGHNQAAGTESKRIKLIHCNADNNRRQGLSVIGAIDVLVQGGSYRNTNGHLMESGIDLEPNPGRIVRDVKIIGTTCEGNAGNGIQVGKNAENSIVMGNTCKNNTNIGIYVGESNNNIVADNQCYGNGMHGIYLLTAHNNTVEDNKIFNNKWYGIYMGSSNDNLIKGNYVHANSQNLNGAYDNINLWDSDFNCIQGNIVRAGTNPNKPANGINISTATCDKNLVIMNDCYNGGTSLGLRDVGNFTVLNGGNRLKDGTWGTVAG